MKDHSDIVGKIFRHYKDKNYYVKNVAKDCETLNDVVVYQALYGDNQVWTRELNDFFAEIDPNKHDNVYHQSHRFELVNFNSDTNFEGGIKKDLK